MCLATPSEFIRYPKGTSCSHKGAIVLEQFSSTSRDPTNASQALKKCEEYCSWHKMCWGCSIICGQACQWNAISECNDVLQWNGLMEGDISRKPGMIE